MPDGSGGGGEGSGNQYGGGDRNGGGNNGGFSQAQFGGESQAAPPAPAAPSGEDRGAFIPTPPTPLGAEKGAFLPSDYRPSALQAAYNQRIEDIRQSLPDSDRGAFLPTYVAENPKISTSILKDLMGKTTDQKIKLGGGKNNPEGREVTVSVPENNAVDILGRNLTYAEAKAFQQAGLGNVVGVNANNMYGTNIPVLGSMDSLVTNNPGQTADSIVAAKDAAEFAGKLFDVAKLFIPGYGAIEFMANLLSGKMTLGQAATSLLGYRAATLLGVSPAVVGGLASGQYGNSMAAYANGVLNSVVSKETGTDSRLTGLLMNTTGLSGLTRNAASPLNVGPNFSGALAGTIDSALSNIGVGKGPSENSVNVPNIGTDVKSQADNIMNSSRMSPTTAPISLDGPATSSAPSTPLSSAGKSSGSYAGASPDMSTLGTANGLYRIGNTNYTPYKQDLAQLNLAPDEFTKQSDIGNIPTYNMDINRMAAAPFSSPFDPFTQYAAEGGSIRNFSVAGAVYEDDPAGGKPAAPTADQLEKRAALQAQAEYYKNLDDEKQNADIMSALKNLSGVGAAEAKPQSSPLLRLGQTGVYTPPKVLPQLAALLQARGMRLAEGGQPDDHKHPNYDGTPVFRTGGLSGLGGKYVEGKGDGTSDDITAMLADGEYVFSADVVSALGNGSNKAGAQVLDKTVEAIRSRARSAPPNKLPPDAKSPLEYMQSVKGKKYG